MLLLQRLGGGVRRIAQPGRLLLRAGASGALRTHTREHARTHASGTQGPPSPAHPGPHSSRIAQLLQGLWPSVAELFLRRSRHLLAAARAAQPGLLSRDLVRKSAPNDWCPDARAANHTLVTLQTLSLSYCPRAKDMVLSSSFACPRRFISNKGTF